MGDQPEQRHPGVSVAGAPVGSLLLQVIRAHAALATEMLAEIGVSAPQELVLMQLAEHGGRWPQSELVRYLGRDFSKVSVELERREQEWNGNVESPLALLPLSIGVAAWWFADELIRLRHAPSRELAT